MTKKNNNVRPDFVSISDCMEQLKNISQRIIGSQCGEEQRCFSLCLSELYFRSHNLIRDINEITKNPCNSKEDLDTLLTVLSRIKIELYDEIADWMTQLQEPLDIIRNKIADEFENE